MKKLYAVLVLAMVSSVFGAGVSTSYSIPVVGIPSRMFNVVTVDSAVAIDTSYIPKGNSAGYFRAYNSFITVEGNDARFSYNLLPSWRNMVKDTLNAAAVIVDTTAGFLSSDFPAGYYMKITATGHHLLDSMMVTFDSLAQYTDTTNGYKVVFSDSANWFAVRLPLRDTVVADTIPATCGYVRTMDFGHVLPDGYIGYINDNYEEISSAYWCSADSAKPATVKFSIHVK